MNLDKTITEIHQNLSMQTYFFSSIVICFKTTKTENAKKKLQQKLHIKPFLIIN